METIKLRIRFNDRIGIVLDVSKALFNYGMNILALQLMNNMMFVEIEDAYPDIMSLVNELESVPNLLSVERINDMPYQSREKQIEAIINSITPNDSPTDVFGEIMGESDVLKKTINLARQVAPTDSTILLKGESGTGKELFARAIHFASRRREKVFVPLNCGAIPENLLESELFGYVDGAFSGAKKGGRVGLFQFACGGTIFLDEISELPASLQVKLLRILQEGRVRPLGANEELILNCRVITATNRNIEEMIKNGLFREDLYYRLNVIPIQIPPLRQRIGDIPLLSENYLYKCCQRGDQCKRLSRAALEKLLSYHWPGNVRELENVVLRALHFSQETEIEAEQIVFDGGIDNVVSTGIADRTSLKTAALRVEKEIILNTLKMQGSIRKTAQALGVSHTTISNKLKKLGIKDGNYN
ncbi:MAG: Fis family transcriptional regulator [Firmicutes bacterium HGW-Firmicutes-12]|nr:MAG: Fis family transcriptional regulator [Firmicutes bacterium HGW-Firmicutes-12]